MNWRTCWNTIKKHAKTSIDINKRASGVKAIGVDEHIWRPSRISSVDKALTVMVDLTRGPDRGLYARLLDAVQSRSGTGYADWLKERGAEVTVSVECAALDPIPRVSQMRSVTSCPTRSRCSMPPRALSTSWSVGLG